MFQSISIYQLRRLGVPNGPTAEPPSPVGGYQQVVASGQAGGGVMLRQLANPTNTVMGSMSSLAASLGSLSGGSASGAEPLNRILNALSNRGLLTQQNGKFYYVGGEKPAAATAANPSGAMSAVSTTTTMATDFSSAQSFKCLPSGEQRAAFFLS